MRKNQFTKKEWAFASEFGKWLDWTILKDLYEWRILSEVKKRGKKL